MQRLVSAQMPRQMDATKYKSREWRFAVEYVRNKGNATEAAMRVFDIGSKGGKRKSRVTAQAVGSEYLWKPLVQGYIVEIARTEFNPHRAAQRIVEIMEDRRNPAQALAAAKLVLTACGMLTPKEDPANDPRVVRLVLPKRKEHS
jgi:hypothetical protein